MDSKHFFEVEKKILPVLYVVIPVLNESGNMKNLISDLKNLKSKVIDKFNLAIILVDDGSTDGTAETAIDLADTLYIKVLRHNQNQGPGAAFATAFEYLSKHLAINDWVVTMEGDNTSRVEVLLQMLVRKDEGFDVVLASPYAYGGGITNTAFIRVVMSAVANSLVKELLGIQGILTMSSFFRLMSAPTILRLQAVYSPRIIETVGFECMVEMLSKLMQEKMTISEVAMTLDTSRRVGKSKMKVFRTVRGYFKLFIRARKWMKNATNEANNLNPKLIDS
ncbi:MAG: glycosyltransferase family 2 protein [Bacteriovoracaceae bacterium]